MLIAFIIYIALVSLVFISFDWFADALEDAQRSRPSSLSPEITPAADAATSSLDDDWADIAQQIKEENRNG